MIGAGDSGDAQVKTERHGGSPTGTIHRLRVQDEEPEVQHVGRDERQEPRNTKRRAFHVEPSKTSNDTASSIPPRSAACFQCARAPLNRKWNA